MSFFFFHFLRISLFRFVLVDFVGFVSFRFHFVDFVSFRFVSFSLTSFRFYFVSHFIGALIKFDIKSKVKMTVLGPGWLNELGSWIT